MHQVKRMRRPDFRIRTGCRCRKTFESTASERFRGSTGFPWRKMDFQTWESVRFSHASLSFFIGSCLRRRSGFQERGRVGPLALFVLEDSALVDEDLSVFRDADRGALERARRGPFEVHAADVIAAAVAGALELLLRRKPVGRAPEVGADGDEGVHLPLVAHDPDPVLLLPSLVDAGTVVLRKACLEGEGRL